MELLDRYLQAVRFWLPKKQQQDIIAELSEDLHSQIDEKERELGHPLNEAEVEAILRRCGSPILVASRYRPRTQLIGPALFPIYLSTLKMVILWTMVPLFVVIIGPATILPAHDRFGAFFAVVSRFGSAVFVSAAIITAIFAIIERGASQQDMFEKWSIESLPELPKKPKISARTQTIFELIFGVIGILWFVAIPHYPFLILGPAAAFLKAGPMWQGFYTPVLLLAVTGLVGQLVSLLRPQWNWFAPVARLVTTAFTMTLLYLLLTPIFHATVGGWQPFLVVNRAVVTADNAAQYNKLASVINACIFLSFSCMWLGLSISGVKQTWELLRELGGRTGPPCEVEIFRFLRP